MSKLEEILHMKLKDKDYLSDEMVRTMLIILDRKSMGIGSLTPAAQYLLKMAQAWDEQRKEVKDA